MAIFGRTKIEQELEWLHRGHVRLRNQTHGAAVKERKRLEKEMRRLDSELKREREKSKKYDA